MTLEPRLKLGYIPFIDPSDKEGVGQSEDGEENEVRADPILALGERGGEEGGNPAKKGEAGKGEWNGEEEKLADGVGPPWDWVDWGELVS